MNDYVRRRAFIKSVKMYAADFETTVDEDTQNQKATEVWSSAFAELFTETKPENVHVYGDIEKSFNYFTSHTKYAIVGYHNLKFDGSFWVDWGLKHGFKLGLTISDRVIGEEGDPSFKACEIANTGIYKIYYKDNKREPDIAMLSDFTQHTRFFYSVEFKSKFELENGEMSCIISGKGQWYSVCFMKYGTLIELQDTLKKLPFTLKKIGKDFETKYKKLDMDYVGKRYANCPISKEEMAYIKNDVLVLKEALEIMLKEGHEKLTIGACCLEEYKNIIGETKWDKWFPNLSDITIDESIFGQKNADEYIRKSYRGGWCYQTEGREGEHYNGLTADVNSLYPSVMHSESGSRYPVGSPTFWRGAIPEEALINDRFYFVRIRCRFKIKEGYLPWLQIKGQSIFYDPTECLKDSDFKYYDKETKTFKKARFIGNREAKPTLTFTCRDYELFKEHYEVYDEEVLDGCWFESEIGIFDEYINKYARIKMTSKGAKRALAKLFLNNLYGKFATSPDSSFKIPYVKEDGSVGFQTVIERKRETVFIAVGSAITSYAKNFTIRTAQKNYHGNDKPGFIYADTDSIHCGCNSPEEHFTADMLIDVPVHDTAFNHWKIESSWDTAQFVRQKTYIEHVTHEDLKPIENPYYNIKCAGLPDKCKKIFNYCLEGEMPDEITIKTEHFTEAHLEYIKEHIAQGTYLKDFNVGLTIPAKLKPSRIKGGVVLVEEEFNMH